MLILNMMLFSLWYYKKNIYSLFKKISSHIDKHHLRKSAFAMAFQKNIFICGEVIRNLM